MLLFYLNYRNHCSCVVCRSFVKYFFHIKSVEILQSSNSFLKFQLNEETKAENKLVGI